MTTFEEYTKKIARPAYTHLSMYDLRAAYEAGQAAPAVITAHQLRARLSKNIATHDEWTRAMVEQSGRFSEFVINGRERMIAKYRDALSIVTELIEVMEAEREAQP